MPDAPKPLLLERIALGAVLLATAACALIKVDPTDTPWHLATARLAFEQGSWPATNSFSWTHPDQPLRQQYPLYQALLYAAFRAGGWPAISLLHAAVWVVVLALWIRWAGGWRAACPLALAWGVALLGMQRRMVIHPGMLTQLWLVLLLLFVERCRAGSRVACAGLVVVQWLMANTHQLFPLGLLVQGLFLLHLLLARRARWGVAPEELPAWPVALALVASVGVCFLTPLGTGVLQVTAATADSLVRHREHVAEFAPITSSGYVTGIACAAALLGLFGLWRSRRRWLPFELGLLLLGLALAAAAIRGVAYLAPLGAALLQRGTARGGVAPARPALRRLAAALALLLCAGPIDQLWLRPRPALEGIEAGLGRKPGAWPDAALAFLRRNPPPGRMLNLSWYSGNALIWGLGPRVPVFVDPRFEAYPREFLLQSIEATESDAALERLIERRRPDWIVAELMLPQVRQRAAGLLRSGRWALVHADTIWLVLLRVAPEHRAYIARHGFPPERIDPPDWLAGRPALLGLQQVRVAWLFHELGLPQQADALLSRARSLARRHPAVSAALVEFYFRRGAERLAAGDHAGALADGDALLALDPRFAGGYLNRAIAQRRLGRPRRARADLDRAIELDPRNASAWYNRGLLRVAEDRSGALVDFDRAIGLDPRHAAAHEERGAARVAAGDARGAESDYRRALELQPRRWRSGVRLARLLARRGERAGALAVLRAARPHAPPLERLRIQKLIDQLSR